MAILLGGGKPEHPLADLKSARRVLAALPISDPYAALEEIAHWLQSARNEAKFRPDYKAQLAQMLDEAAQAMRTVADRVHVVMEGAAACAVAAALSPEMARRGHKKVVAVVSGGNIDLSKFAKLTGSCE